MSGGGGRCNTRPQKSMMLGGAAAILQHGIRHSWRGASAQAEGLRMFYVAALQFRILQHRIGNHLAMASQNAVGTHAHVHNTSRAIVSRMIGNQYGFTAVTRGRADQSSAPHVAPPYFIYTIASIKFANKHARLH